MTLASAKRITGLDIQVVIADKECFVEALDAGKSVANVSGSNLKKVLLELVAKVYALNRKAALERAGWKCELCGSIHNLQCHHKIHRSMGRRDDTVSNLQVLCFQCHERHHLGKD